MGFTPVAVETTRLNPDGSAPAGTITFTLVAEMLNGTTLVQPSPIVGVFNPAGQLVQQDQQSAIILLANDDVGTTPADPTSAYRVVEQLAGTELLSYIVYVLHAATITETDGAAVLDSNVVQLNDVIASGAMVGQPFSGPGFADGTTVLSVSQSANTVTVSNASTETVTGATYVIGGGVDLSTLAQYAEPPELVAYIPWVPGDEVGDFLRWNGTAWVSSSVAPGGVDSVTAADSSVTVDNDDPANPTISAAVQLVAAVASAVGTANGYTDEQISELSASITAAFLQLTGGTLTGDLDVQADVTIDSGGQLVANDGSTAKMRMGQKSNSEIVWSYNVDQNNSDAIDDPTASAFKFSMQGTEGGGYDGLHLQYAPPDAPGGWGDSSTVFTLDGSGDVWIAGTFDTDGGLAADLDMNGQRLQNLSQAGEDGQAVEYAQWQAALVDCIQSLTSEDGSVSLTPDGTNVDLSVADTVATALASAESFTTAAVLVETDRAESAEELLSPLASPTGTGTATWPVVAASGITGATSQTRWVGANPQGPPTTGTFALGDIAADQQGAIWVCYEAGSPGSWVRTGQTCITVGRPGSGADYICTGDYATGGDDVLINAAIAEASANSVYPSGPIANPVLVLAGWYYLTNPIAVNYTNLSLRGVGNSTVFCRALNGTGYGNVIIGANATDGLAAGVSVGVGTSYNDAGDFMICDGGIDYTISALATDATGTILTVTTNGNYEYLAPVTGQSVRIIDHDGNALAGLGIATLLGGTLTRGTSYTSISLGTGGLSQAVQDQQIVFLYDASGNSQAVRINHSGGYAAATTTLTVVAFTPGVTFTDGTAWLSPTGDIVNPTTAGTITAISASEYSVVFDTAVTESWTWTPPSTAKPNAIRFSPGSNNGLVVRCTAAVNITNVLATCVRHDGRRMEGYRTVTTGGTTNNEVTNTGFLWNPTTPTTAPTDTWNLSFATTTGQLLLATDAISGDVEIVQVVTGESANTNVTVRRGYWTTNPIACPAGAAISVTTLTAQILCNVANTYSFTLGRSGTVYDPSCEDGLDSNCRNQGNGSSAVNFMREGLWTGSNGVVFLQTHNYSCTFGALHWSHTTNTPGNLAMVQPFIDSNAYNLYVVGAFSFQVSNPQINFFVWTTQLMAFFSCDDVQIDNPQYLNTATSAPLVYAASCTAVNVRDLTTYAFGGLTSYNADAIYLTACTRGNIRGGDYVFAGTPPNLVNLNGATTRVVVEGLRTNCTTISETGTGADFNIWRNFDSSGTSFTPTYVGANTACYGVSYVSGGARAYVPAINPPWLVVPTAITFEDQASDPAAPTTAFALYSKQRAGRSLPHFIAEVGAARSLQAALFDIGYTEILPGISTTPALAGALATYALLGVGSSIAAVTPPTSGNGRGLLSQRITTSNAGGVLAGVRTGIYYQIGGGGAGTGGGVLFVGKHYLNDSAYANTGAATGVRLQVGLSNSLTTDLAHDNGLNTNQLAAFTYANVNGGALNTTWQFSTANGTTLNVTDTGLVVTAGHDYKFYIFVANGGSTIYWTVQDLTAATSESGSTATDIPAASTLLAAGAGVYSVDAVIRTIDLLRIYIEQDQG